MFMRRLILAAVAATLFALPLHAQDKPASTPPAKAAKPVNKAPAKPVVIAKAQDVWQLFPEDIRPGKDGKVTDELLKKAGEWLKENGEKIEGKVQFDTDSGYGSNREVNIREIFEDLKSSEKTFVHARLIHPDDLKKSGVDPRKPGAKTKVVWEIEGGVESLSIKTSKKNGSSFILRLSDARIKKIKQVQE